MLGRQQIAGIPTAVSEIFKNAYDAYATEVRGDYYPARSAVTIRDNGTGMSITDFLERWLVIGTDSKVADRRETASAPPPGMEPRRQMGEKGIGRLAVATLGPQLLVVSGARGARSGAPGELVVALLQWTLFEVPGLTLNDVVVPVRTVKTIADVSPALLVSMSDEVRASLSELGARVGKDRQDRIRRELDLLTFDPRPYCAAEGPNLAAEPGTTYIVSPVSEDLEAALEERKEQGSGAPISDFQKFLIGFTNPITPTSSTPDFATSFWRWDGAQGSDLIEGVARFWDESDFAHADHTVEGEFDELGRFHGQLRIYGDKPVDIVELWKGNARNERTACGPFSIKFGYVQGKASESTLSPDEFVEMTARLNRIGGLYVYRDGIRVLPYGNSDVDYLEIEKRRTLNAGTYYFSYRRMFGAVSLDSQSNHRLQEKAGREGFRENAAFRDFESILSGFLIQIAASYFSRRTSADPTWRDQRQNVARRAEQSKAEKRARDEFRKELHKAIGSVESGAFASGVQGVLRDTRSGLAHLVRQELASDLPSLASVSVEALFKLRAGIAISRPAGLPLTSELERDWAAYKRLSGDASAVMQQAFDEIEVLLLSARHKLGMPQDEPVDSPVLRRLRLLAENRQRELTSMAAEVRQAADAAREVLGAHADQSVTQFEESARDLIESLGRVDGGEAATAREIEASAERRLEEMRSTRRRAEDLVSQEGLHHETVDLKERILDLEEQIDENLELVQLGQAVQVISHEFEASIASVRNGLRGLDPWARATPPLAPLVRDIRAAFTHLDGYLRLFTPLQRRLYREASSIAGADIHAFLLGVFEERMRVNAIEITATDAFLRAAVKGYPSTFYPVFVNLVDNAMHWVLERETGRAVRLDARHGAFLIADNGPGVRPADREAIFVRGFGRRRGGRGLGLSLARDLLARDGWRLVLEANNPGAAFKIERVQGDDSGA